MEQISVDRERVLELQLAMKDRRINELEQQLAAQMIALQDQREAAVAEATPDAVH